MKEEIVLLVHPDAVTSAYILPPQLVMSAILEKWFLVSIKKKDVQLESCELSFIWGKVRTVALKAASKIALRDCSIAAVGDNQYIRFW